MKPSRVFALMAVVALLPGASASALAQGPAAGVVVAPSLSQAAPPAQTAAPASAGNKKDKDWDVVIYPILAYIPLAGIDITLPPAPPCPGCGDETPTANGDTGLSGAAFADFRVEKGRFAIEANANYAGLQAERSTPFLNLKVKLINGGAWAGFRVAPALFAEAGAKYHELDITASVASFPEVKWKPNAWRPMVGTTFRPDLMPWLRLFTHLDYTGFGGDALSTVNGQARVEIRPIRHLALTAGYGFSHLIVNGEIKSKPIHLDYTMHGPIFGIGIPF